MHSCLESRGCLSRFCLSEMVWEQSTKGRGEILHKARGCFWAFIA